MYRNGVFGNEYLCIFSWNLTRRERERERENHIDWSRMQFAPFYLPDSIRILPSWIRLAPIESGKEKTRSLKYLKKFHLSELGVSSTDVLISDPQFSRGRFSTLVEERAVELVARTISLGFVWIFLRFSSATFPPGSVSEPSATCRACCSKCMHLERPRLEGVGDGLRDGS